MTDLWRAAVGRIAGLQMLRFESDAGGPGSGAGIDLELSHRNIDTLKAAGRELAASLMEFGQINDVDDDSALGKRQIDFTVKPLGRALGLDAQTIARQVRTAFYGAEALRQQRGRNEVKVMVRYPESQRISQYDIEEMIIRNTAGLDVPLRDVVTMKHGRAYTTIQRRQGRRVINVTANVTPRSEAGHILDTVEQEILPVLRQHYPGLTCGRQGRQADMAESMGSLKTGFIFALLGIYVLLAIPFGSYVQPLIIMTSIPFGIIGAILGHVVMGYSLSVISLFGVVALAGVVVNDVLVLVDFANRKHREGLSPARAIHAAGVQRFRPIMLTTLTTFGGLAPMIFETSRQARFMIPMAISLGYGILFATAITLLLAPSLYLIVEDLKALRTS